MSTPNGTGASRRVRIAGLALLGLAVIAVLVGVVATVGGEPTPAAAPPAATSTSSSAPAIPSTIPYPPTSSPAAAPVVPPLGPPDAAQGAPPGEEQRVDQSPLDQSASRGEVRVYNNSTIRGLAARAADDLTAAGWTVIEVGNYAQGTIPTTTAYYQEGTDQRDYAEAIGAEFGMRVEPRFPGIANADSGLIVIVTNDYMSP